MSDAASTQGTPARAATSKILGHSNLPVAELHRFVNSVVKNYICTYIPIEGSPVDAPRYGALSHVIQGLPVVLFDHPDMCKRFETAFTQGTHIFMNAHFIYEMLRQDAASQMRECRVRFVMLHEALHCAFRHCEGRLAGGAPPKTLNYVLDAVNNARLLGSYQDIKIGALANKIVAGTDRGIDFFKEMSEEAALSLFLKDPHQFAQKAGMPPPREKPELHFGSPRDFAKWMEEGGLASALGDLGIPASTDREAHERLAQQIRDHINQAAERTMRDASAARAAGKRLPGSHIDEAFIETVELLNKPRLDFRVKLRQALRELGGTRFSVSDDIPDDLRYTSAGEMGFASQPWLPGRGPVAKTSKTVLCLVDTSGSMGNADLGEAFTEIFAFARSARAHAPQVLVHCADTALRGRPLRLIPQSRELLMEQNGRQVEAAGRGGTDLTECLIQISERYAREIKAGNVASILYFSDLGDNPPDRAKLPARLPRITFICPSSQFSSNFAEAVATWADVVPIEDHQIVRIEDRPAQAPTPQPTRVTAPVEAGPTMG